VRGCVPRILRQTEDYSLGNLNGLRESLKQPSPFEVSSDFISGFTGNFKKHHVRSTRAQRQITEFQAIRSRRDHEKGTRGRTCPRCLTLAGAP